MRKGNLSIGNELEKVPAQNSMLTGNTQSNQTDNTIFLLEKIKSPKNGERIDTAIRMERRIRLHTVGTQDYSTAFDLWLDKIRDLLPAEKYNIFIKLITEPVPTLDLTETIFDELAKIFESSNRDIYLSFKQDSERLTEQFNDYINLDRYFKNEVYDMFKVAPNSFIVVDTKTELDSNNQVQPITYFVHLESIIDFDVTRDGKTNYILFKSDNDRIIGIDNYNYYVFDVSNGKTPVLLDNYPSAHNLTDTLGRPYTPAFLIYPDFLNVTDNVVVNSPLTKALGNLDWLLFWAISKRYLDLYAPFPIYVSFEEDCSYVHPSGAQCTDGYLSIVSGNDTEDLESSTVQIPCPKCSKQKMFGAGSEVTVPAPQSKDDPNLIDAVKVIPASKDSIEYVTGEQERLEQKIYYAVLGKTSQPLENFSQSIAQLDLSTESRKAVLIHIKEVFEQTHYWTLYTLAKLRFGDDFVDCNVNYGDNYFLTTQEQETDRYKKLKDTGAPESILHASLESIVKTTYKTAPQTRLLQQVYLEVEPYQTMSIESVMKLSQQGLIPRKKAISKIHFTDFIEEYENEHSTLISTIQNGESDKSALVKLLKRQLDEYASKVMSSIDEQPSLVPDIKLPDLTKPSSTNKRMYRGDTEEL